jgi:hypothetical protein
MKNLIQLLCILASLGILGGCALEVVRSPVNITLVKGSEFVLTQPAYLVLDSGYQRTINSGTTFLEIGTTQYGMVLKPLNTSFTIEGAHMHEAYPVIQNGAVTGFYLPVEKSFSPLTKPIAISIEKVKK